jgi:hypothetical protein
MIQVPQENAEAGELLGHWELVVGQDIPQHSRGRLQHGHIIAPAIHHLTPNEMSIACGKHGPSGNLQRWTRLGGDLDEGHGAVVAKVRFSELIEEIRHGPEQAVAPLLHLLVLQVQVQRAAAMRHGPAIEL